MKQEALNWREGENSSALYFGDYLFTIRMCRGQGLEAWAELGTVSLDRYKLLEQGEEDQPPSVEEIDQWARRWNLARDEIIDLKIIGGHDVSAYLPPLTEEGLARGIKSLLDEPQPLFIRVLSKLIRLLP